MLPEVLGQKLIASLAVWVSSSVACVQADAQPQAEADAARFQAIAVPKL